MGAHKQHSGKEQVDKNYRDKSREGTSCQIKQKKKREGTGEKNAKRKAGSKGQVDKITEKKRSKTSVDKHHRETPEDTGGQKPHQKKRKIEDEDKVHKLHEQCYCLLTTGLLRPSVDAGCRLVKITLLWALCAPSGYSHDRSLT